MTKDREKYARDLDKQFEGGRASTIDVMKAKAEYDASIATKRMSLYAMLSTVAAAISAAASAVAAYLTYRGLP